MCSLLYKKIAELQLFNHYIGSIYQTQPPTRPDKFVKGKIFLYIFLFILSFFLNKKHLPLFIYFLLFIFILGWDPNNHRGANRLSFDQQSR